jgi:hypothetical protein
MDCLNKVASRMRITRLTIVLRLRRNCALSAPFDFTACGGYAQGERKLKERPVSSVRAERSGSEVEARAHSSTK